jgi:hypothetical protein
MWRVWYRSQTTDRVEIDQKPNGLGRHNFTPGCVFLPTDYVFF